MGSFSVKVVNFDISWIRLLMNYFKIKTWQQMMDTVLWWRPLMTYLQRFNSVLLLFPILCCTFQPWQGAGKLSMTLWLIYPNFRHTWISCIHCRLMRLLWLHSLYLCDHHDGHMSSWILRHSKSKSVWDFLPTFFQPWKRNLLLQITLNLFRIPSIWNTVFYLLLKATACPSLWITSSKSWCGH
jgi:hypothetical protein